MYLLVVLLVVYIVYNNIPDDKEKADDINYKPKTTI